MEKTFVLELPEDYRWEVPGEKLGLLREKLLGNGMFPDVTTADGAGHSAELVGGRLLCSFGRASPSRSYEVFSLTLGKSVTVSMFPKGGPEVQHRRYRGEFSYTKGFRSGAFSSPGFLRILSTVDVGESRGIIISERCRCGLDRWLEESRLARLDPEMRMALAAKNVKPMLEALVQLHDAGYCHFGLELGHFSLREDGSLVISNFELLGRLGFVPEYMGALGNCCHLPPEFALGSISGNSKCDLWSVGAVLREIAIGDQSFQPSLSSTRVSRDPQDWKSGVLSELAKKLPDYRFFVDTILAMCNPDPLSRPEAEELLERFRVRKSAAAGIAVPERTEKLSEKLSPEKRHGPENPGICVTGGGRLGVPEPGVVDGGKIPSSSEMQLLRGKLLGNGLFPDVGVEPLVWRLPNEKIGGRDVIKIREDIAGSVYRVYSSAPGMKRFLALRVLAKETVDAAGELLYSSKFRRTAFGLGPGTTLEILSSEDDELNSGIVLAEYCGCGDLRQLLSKDTGRAGASEDSLLDTMGSLLTIFRGFHASGFFHFDVKPENILIREDGTPVVVGFSLATGPELDEEAKQRLGKFGTPQYMPPELLIGGAVYPLAYDVWSLGMVFFGLLTGHQLFGHLDLKAIEEKMRLIVAGPEVWRDKIRGVLGRHTGNCLALDLTLAMLEPDHSRRPTFCRLAEEFSRRNEWLGEQPKKSREPVSGSGVLANPFDPLGNGQSDGIEKFWEELENRKSAAMISMFGGLEDRQSESESPGSGESSLAAETFTPKPKKRGAGPEELNFSGFEGAIQRLDLLFPAAGARKFALRRSK
ncbi:MAG: protein kinase [Rickettsiales bacterium]|jgi:serine/threonine protein kinase|nr:protein kinase [Rickettsiales bacterium]